MLGVNQLVNEKEMSKLLKATTVQLVFPDQALGPEMCCFAGKVIVIYSQFLL